MEDALALGNSLIDGGHMNHVVKDHRFKNEKLFYRFTIHDKDHGHVPEVCLADKRMHHGNRHSDKRNS